MYVCLLTEAAPVFTRPLQNCTARDGSRVVLSCVVAALPAPRVSWYHNDRHIDPQGQEMKVRQDYYECSSSNSNNNNNNKSSSS